MVRRMARERARSRAARRTTANPPRKPESRRALSGSTPVSGNGAGGPAAWLDGAPGPPPTEKTNDQQD
jgi:hypothetical protein